ncbi:hypothetical protein J8273_6498 [Carpediemonas membranifera]|uniref:Uncharacterized protein n=1 Tax=Carpediemonas membranifera TaxID=201153 RepID=A0A8J6B7N3_9EUKA|nr:hypothetical protein J8273_6498 [Carpediemonas membranifera]|eukprot:KAG9391722.1 hypothetical protein J8273_6498 [Carpediemonas membranifera]
MDTKKKPVHPRTKTTATGAKKVAKKSTTASTTTSTKPKPTKTISTSTKPKVKKTTSTTKTTASKSKPKAVSQDEQPLPTVADPYIEPEPCACKTKPPRVDDWEAQAMLLHERDAFFEKQMKQPFWTIPMGTGFAPWLGVKGTPKTGMEAAIWWCTTKMDPPKMPLLLDPDEAHAVDTFYSYRHTMILEAKKMVVDTMQGQRSHEQIMEDNRKALVNAMKYGETLYIRLANGAPDFKEKYTDPESFPIEVFDQEAVSEVMTRYADRVFDEKGELKAGDNLFESTHPFGKCVQYEDTDQGYFLVRRGFEVIVESHFTTDDFAEFLEWSLPMDKMQPIHVTIN